MSKPKSVEKLPFEDALAELEEIVAELEQGDAPLDEAIARFERGVALSRRCEDRLGEAEKKLAVLLKQGTRITEVDMESGETLSEQEDPGEDIAPTAKAPKVTAAPKAPKAPTKSAAAEAQQSLIGGLGDDDIPF
jgi:exodeoxyribonuclease VII small subunit